MVNKVFYTLLMLGLIASPSFALVGLGFHWTSDHATSMKDWEGGISLEALSHGDLGELSAFRENDLIRINRSNFDETAFNFGFKVFLDPRILPFEIEAGLNFGYWEYIGSISYLDIENSTIGDIRYSDPVVLSAKDLIGRGDSKTPYSKVNLDFTIRKPIFKRLPLLHPTLGAGFSMHWETPVLSDDLVMEALGSDVDPASIAGAISDGGAKAIFDLIEDGSKEPKAGVHFVAGTYFKLPVFPLGVYVDGKYHIIFNNSDYEVDNSGFILNLGVLFKI